VTAEDGFLIPYFAIPSLMISTLRWTQPAISMAPQKGDLAITLAEVKVTHREAGAGT